MTRHCNVCGADKSDECRASGGEIAECPRPSPAFRRFFEDVQAECRQIVRARHLNAAERQEDEKS